jgi:hypothetical protein
VPELTFIRGNVDNVRGYEKAGSQKGPAHLKIVLHYWGKQKAYWGICPSSYIVKNALKIILNRLGERLMISSGKKEGKFLRLTN